MAKSITSFVRLTLLIVDLIIVRVLIICAHMYLFRRKLRRLHNTSLIVFIYNGSKLVSIVTQLVYERKKTVVLKVMHFSRA